MNTKEELYTKKYIVTPEDKQTFIQMNSHVIRLLQDKLLPLRREKYQHLQKINLALRKDKNFHKKQKTHSLHKIRLKKTGQTKIRNGMTSRISHKDVTQQILLDLLKKMSHLSQSTPKLSIKENCQSVCEKLAKSQLTSKNSLSNKQEYESFTTYQNCLSNKYTSTKTSLKNQKKVTKEPFLDIALRAERHLRMRKHELHQKYLEEHEGKRAISKIAELQKKEPHLRQKHFKMTSEAQLQRQLLEDIRETMLEEKINKLKRNINHKKIVQLR